MRIQELLGDLKELPKKKQARDTRSASEKVWNFSWDQHFPHIVEEMGVTLDIISFDEFNEFASIHFEGAFDFSTANRFTRPTSTEARVRYLREHADFFGIFGNGELIGVVMGTVTDWTTYHIRNMTLKGDQQGNGVGPVMTARIGSVLKTVGVVKVEAFVSPANYKSMATIYKVGGIPLGYENSDQWGALVKMVIFLDPADAEPFLSLISAYSKGAHQAAMGPRKA